LKKGDKEKEGGSGVREKQKTAAGGKSVPPGRRPKGHLTGEYLEIGPVPA